MGKNYEMRMVRVDDFVAETLEAEADRMPPSYAEQATIMREQAQTFRSSSNANTLRVWEEVPAKFQNKVSQ